MFYDPRENLRPAPLSHNPLNALVAPRPIGWISTISANDEWNLAPFSYFNAFSADPPVVGFAPNAKPGDGGAKDSLANVRAVPEFTVSVVSAELAEQMNETSRALPHGVSEYEAAGLAAGKSRLVRPPYVDSARAVLECHVFDIVSLPAREGGRGSHLVLGEVIGIHIDDTLIVDGRVDTRALRPMSRLGYFDYAVVNELFEMLRPE
jgi:flavin reductase (DIM6/NTAB) family NADH-FMN oxidoreductase RutF